MNEKKALTDEQLEQVGGGGTTTISHEGVTLTLGGPETYLEFSEMERTYGHTAYAGMDWGPDYDKVSAYQSWYYDYYGCPHPNDQR